MDDFNAKQAKQIADKHYIKQFSECITAIKHEANKGKYHLEIKEELHRHTILKLKELGFYFTNYIPADIKRKEGVYHTISWKDV